MRNEMGGTCSRRGEMEMHIEFQWENLKNEGHLGHLGRRDDNIQMDHKEGGCDDVNWI
jgi:hypothetical protein